MNASTRYRRFQPRLHQLEDRATPAAGMLDPTFGDGGRVTSRLPTASGEEGRATAIDSMGRILVAGSGSDGLGSDFAITRYLPEGALDTSFGGTGIVTIDLGSAYDEAYSVAVDSLDRVVVAGTTYRNTAIGSYSDFAVARLTVSGALDASFDSDGKQTVDFWHSDEAYAVAVDSLDRIVVVGRGYNQFSVARLTAAGALDTTFDGDGKWFGISGGSAAFGVAVDSLDRILVAGYQYGLTSDFDFAVVRLTAAGALDPSFGAAGSQIISFGSRADYARSVAVDSMDRVVVAGITSYESTPTTSSFAVARLTSSGELDASFDADGKQTIAIGPYYGESGVAVDSLDRVVVVGSTYSGPDSNFAVARLTAAGALDTSFDGDGKQTISFGGFDNLAYGVAVDWRNRIVVAGEASRDFAVARLTAAGALDQRFDGDGKQTTDFAAASLGFAHSVAVDSLGRTVVAGWSGWYADFAIARYTTAGALDTSFGGTGIVTIDFGGSYDVAYSVAIDSLDRVVVAGTTRNGSNDDFAVARLTAAGALDTSFDGDGKQAIAFGASNDWAYSAAVDSQDRVVVAGESWSGSNHDFAVARLTASGALDTAFDGDGKLTIAFGEFDDGAYGVAFDSEDRVVVAGTTWSGSNYDFAVARLTAAGALDASFDGDGKLIIVVGASNDMSSGVAVDSLDRVVVAGTTSDGTFSDVSVARLTASGALDNSFDGDGKVTFDFESRNTVANAMAVDAQNRVLIAGYEYGPDGDSAFAVARLTSTGALDSTYDGDGRVAIDFGLLAEEASGLTIDSDGRAVIAGSLSHSSTTWGPDWGVFAVARLTGDEPAPTVAVTTINTGAVQRSRITELTITFSAQVTFAGAIGNAFRFERTGGGDVIFDASANVVNGVTVVTFDKFTGPETEFGSLRDGQYTLRTLASQISAGGQQMAANYDFNFHRFYGDMNGDARVDIADFGFFSLAYFNPLNYNAAFDFNRDGRIDLADFGQFGVRFFANLP